MSTEVTLAEATRWAEGLTKKICAAGEECTINVMDGPRYLRIVQEYPRGPNDNYDRRSTYGFIDRRTGLIYKTAGWKGPSIKTPPRGDIRGADPYKGCERWGMELRKGGRKWTLLGVEVSHEEVFRPPTPALDYDPIND